MTTEQEVLAMLKLGPATTQEIIAFCEGSGAVLGALHRLHLSNRISYWHFGKVTERIPSEWRIRTPATLCRQRKTDAGIAAVSAPIRIRRRAA